MTDDDLQLAVDRFIGVDDKVSKWGDVLDVETFAGEDVILKCGSTNWIISPKRVYQLHIKTFYILITLIPEYINALHPFYHIVLTRWKWTEIASQYNFIHKILTTRTYLIPATSFSKQHTSPKPKNTCKENLNFVYNFMHFIWPIITNI